MGKMLFIHPANDFTGSTRVLQNIIKNEYLSCSKAIITIDGGKGLLSELENVRIYNIWFPRFRGKIIPGVSVFISYIYRIVLLFFLCFKYDCFYVNTVIPSYAIVVLSVLHKRIMWHIHEILPNDGIVNKFRNGIVRKAKAHFIFVSNYVADAYTINKLSTQEVKYNKLSKEFTNNIVINPCSNRSRSRVLMVASLSPFKGIPVLLEVARKMKRCHFTLVLGSSEQEVDTFLVDNNIPDNCEVLHQVNDLSGVYYNNDILLNLTNPGLRKETFGMTIIEAFAYGIPVVAPNAGGPREIVDNGLNGLLVDVTNDDVVIDSISYILEDQMRYEAFSNNAYKASLRFKY